MGEDTDGYAQINDDNPIKVANGQQSENYYIFTGKDFDTAADTPVILDSVQLSAKQTWVTFGPGNEWNTINKGEFMTAFRVTAGNDEGGLVKYITFNPPQQTGSGQDFATIGRVKVVIQDVDSELEAGNDIRGEVEVDDVGEGIYVVENTTSQNVLVRLEPLPASQVSVTLLVDTSSDTDSEPPNNANTVTLSSSDLSFAPYDDMGKLFNLTVSGWDADLGDTFRVNFGFSGTNAASFTAGEVGSLDHLKFKIVTLDDLQTPSLNLEEGGLKTGQWSFEDVTVTANDPGDVCFLILPESIPKPGSAADLFDWSSNSDGTKDNATRIL